MFPPLSKPLSVVSGKGFFSSLVSGKGPPAATDRSKRRRRKSPSGRCRPPCRKSVSSHYPPPYHSPARAPHSDTHRIPKRPAGCTARTFGSSERADRLPPAAAAAHFRKAARAASRHAPHPKTPSRLRGKNVRFVGRSGSLPREPQPVPDAPFAGAPPIPSPNTLALRHAVRLRIDGFPQKRKPLLFSRGFRGKLGRDDWIRTSDNTPPRRVL